VLVTLLSLVLANPPAGYVPASSAALTPAGVASRAAGLTRPEVDWREMLQTPQFYQLWVMFVLAASAGLMIISQMALIAKDQAHIDAWGFLPVALLALFNTLGRVLSGFLSDRIGRSKTMVLAFALQAINMFIFVHYTTPAWLLFGAAFAGLCYGTIFTLFPATTADFYGVRNLGVNYGLIFTGFGVAGVLGPIVGARIRDASGSYGLAFIIAMGMLLLGALLALTLRSPKPQPVSEASKPVPEPSHAARP